MAFTLKNFEPVRPRAALVSDPSGSFTWTWYGWFRDLQATLTGNQSKVASLLNSGFTGTITTAKLTAGGANGSMTFTNGVLTAQVPAT